MLPFEKEFSRKWSCFVCGFETKTFESFKDHIIEKHDEGRDYLLCPLDRCQAPVRCIKTHFKFKHPDEPLPKCEQLRALIWKDAKNPRRTKKPKFREGYFISMKNNGKEFFYRSSYECEVLECLENLPEIVSFYVEPFKEGIRYLYKGKFKKYFPDLAVTFDDGHMEVWEIKPASQTSLPMNEAKWIAANEYCRSRGWNFIVITEIGIGKLKTKLRNINN